MNGVNGVILLPDNWSSRMYRLRNTNKGDASFSSNNITQSDWTNKFETNGAVFLPATGGAALYNVDSYGCFWSAPYYSSYNAHYVSFDDWSFEPDDWNDRQFGRSVRLVCPAEN